MLLKSYPSRSNYPHTLLTLPAFFTARLCRVFITSWLFEMFLSTYQFWTIKRGCFPQAKGSITSRLMTGRVPDCRQAPCTCFNCASFLSVSTENGVCLLFFSKGWWSRRPEHLLDFSTSSTDISEAFFSHLAFLGTKMVMCNFHLPVERCVL